MTWFLPYATQIINSTQYLEIDASFKACNPFKFCIYHGIIFNVSIHYIFFNCARRISKFLRNINKKNFEGKEVLSDMGIFIKTFSEKHKI